MTIWSPLLFPRPHPARVTHFSSLFAGFCLIFCSADLPRGSSSKLDTPEEGSFVLIFQFIFYSACPTGSRPKLVRLFVGYLVQLCAPPAYLCYPRLGSPPTLPGSSRDTDLISYSSRFLIKSFSARIPVASAQIGIRFVFLKYYHKFRTTTNDARPRGVWFVCERRFFPFFLLQSPARNGEEEKAFLKNRETTNQIISNLYLIVLFPCFSLF